MPNLVSDYESQHNAASTSRLLQPDDGEDFAAYVNPDYFDDDLCDLVNMFQSICCPENMSHNDWDNALFRIPYVLFRNRSRESFIATIIMMAIILTTFAVLL